ncbi:MAG: hypothetical protein ACYTFT_12180 [Planctomycetota bacterium]
MPTAPRAATLGRMKKAIIAAVLVGLVGAGVYVAKFAYQPDEKAMTDAGWRADAAAASAAAAASGRILIAKFGSHG